MCTWYCCGSSSCEVSEVVLTREEQEHKPLLGSSKSSAANESGGRRHPSKPARARSALLLKESLLQMHKQPPDAVRQHLIKVSHTVFLPAFFSFPFKFFRFNSFLLCFFSFLISGFYLTISHNLSVS